LNSISSVPQVQFGLVLVLLVSGSMIHAHKFTPNKLVKHDSLVILDRLICLFYESCFWVHDNSNLGGISVQTLREHRIDAETLFEIAKTFSTQVQSYCNSGVSPSEFMASLIHEFGRRTTKLKNRVCIKWKEIGMLVSPIFSKDHGCSTMYVSYLYLVIPDRSFSICKDKAASIWSSNTLLRWD